MGLYINRDREEAKSLPPQKNYFRIQIFLNFSNFSIINICQVLQQTSIQLDVTTTKLAKMPNAVPREPVTDSGNRYEVRINFRRFIEYVQKVIIDSPILPKIKHSQLKYNISSL